MVIDHLNVVVVDYFIVFLVLVFFLPMLFGVLGGLFTTRVVLRHVLHVILDFMIEFNV